MINSSVLLNAECLRSSATNFHMESFYDTSVLYRILCINKSEDKAVNLLVILMQSKVVADFGIHPYSSLTHFSRQS